MLQRFSVPLFRVAGIPVRMSLLLPILFVLFVVSTPGYADASFLGRALGGLLILVTSVFLHECGHAYAARREGLGVHRIQISVFGGFTEHDPAGSMGGELRVSLAGVAVNLAIALVAGAAQWAASGTAPGLPRLSLAGEWLGVIYSLNLSLALFNLLPGIPFDGGHAVEALLSRRFGRVKGRTAVVISGAIIGAGFLVGGIANGDAILSMVGFYCLTAVGSAWREIQAGEVEEPALFGAYDFTNGYTSLERSEPRPAKEPKARARERERVRRETEEHESAVARRTVDSKDRLDRLLDRIAAEGIASLSPEERTFLNDESRRLRDRRRTPTRP